MKRVLGTMSLVVVTAGQPLLGEIADPDRARRHERHDDTGAEPAWQPPPAGPIDMSDFVADDARVTVTGAGNVPPGQTSKGTASFLVSEGGKVGEVFHLSGIEMAILIEGARFVGPPTMSSPYPASACISADRRSVTLRLPANRRVPGTYSVSGIKVEADADVPDGTTVEWQITLTDARRLPRTKRVGSPGTVRA